jgi:hypothetical protein
MYMWRAVDSEGEVLEILIQPLKVRLPSHRDRIANITEGPSRATSRHRDRQTVVNVKNLTSLWKGRKTSVSY